MFPLGQFRKREITVGGAKADIARANPWQASANLGEAPGDPLNSALIAVARARFRRRRRMQGSLAISEPEA
jgi:hypothetical protein